MQDMKISIILLSVGAIRCPTLLSYTPARAIAKTEDMGRPSQPNYLAPSHANRWREEGGLS
jgi:hypothetical protein